MAVLETPWFMKTKTSDLRKVNQVFEERFQRQVTIIEMKQRKALTKIDEEMHMLRKERRRIRTEVDYTTDLDEHGNKVGLEANRSKSTGDIPRGDGSDRSGVDRHLRTRTAMRRHRKFVQALHVNKNVLSEQNVTDILREKYADGNELKTFDGELKYRLNARMFKFKPRRLKQRRTNKTTLKLGTDMSRITTLSDVTEVSHNQVGNGIGDIKDVTEHLPTANNGLTEPRQLPSVSGAHSKSGKLADKRFSISTPRKSSNGPLPAIKTGENKQTKALVCRSSTCDL